MRVPRAALLAFCVLLVASLGLPGPTAATAPVPFAPHAYKPIQPGAQQVDGDNWCTLDFVFRDAASLYIGGAAHCSPAVGARVASPTLGAFGTVVYKSFTSANGHSAEDFALYLIDADKVDQVDPAVRNWGGPTGVAEAPAPGTLLMHTGHGAYVSSAAPLRPRLAVLQGVNGADSLTTGSAYEGWYLAEAAVLGGDSGSPMLTQDGAALGTVIGVAATYGDAAILNGPTLPLILADLRAAGLDVSLVTAPFTGVGAGDVESTVADCVAQPTGEWASDACARAAPVASRRDFNAPTTPFPDTTGWRALGHGHIVAGGPYVPEWTIAEIGSTYYPFLVAGNYGDNVLPVDGFFLPAPPAGTPIATRTTDPNGLVHDIDIYFRTNWNYLNGPGCATPRADEACVVPQGAAFILVAAYAGADLDVEVLTPG
ncbi:MAG: hypothetical protein QOE90_1266 [Thermoplasmata archaeon]|jgi:hypothetical protein|nr:hypothetical protein [Thermoplasmata archaeon]